MIWHIVNFVVWTAIYYVLARFRLWEAKLSLGRMHRELNRHITQYTPTTLDDYYGVPPKVADALRIEELIAPPK